MLSSRIHLCLPQTQGDRRYLAKWRRPSSRCELGLRAAIGGLRCSVDPRMPRVVQARSGLAEHPLMSPECVDPADVLLEETVTLNRAQKTKGKVSVRLVPGDDNGGGKRKLIVGCNLEGKWLLHWGVSYQVEDDDCEWDLPPSSMMPEGSIPIRDYAVETPFKKCSPDLVGNTLNEVSIELDLSSPVASIHFVLKDEETGNWYGKNGNGDFTVRLFDNKLEDHPGQKHVSKLKDPQINEKEVEGQENHPCFEGFYEEFSITKEENVQNTASVSIARSYDKDRNFLHFDTDIPGKITLHWGVCRDDTMKWEVPAAPFPPHSRVFRNKALQTSLQKKSVGVGSWGVFPLEKDVGGVLFVLKLEDKTWVSDMGKDFYIPLANSDLLCQSSTEKHFLLDHNSKASSDTSRNHLETDEIINDIRSLVTDISSEKKMITTSKEAQETILEEIEKLAAEAYSIFRSSTPTFVEDIATEYEKSLISIQICSPSGSGNEILCQGFNWESHSSGKWYSNLREKASDLYNIGLTALWLPPPTESVSPQGYMPKDLYNLNSRYGTVDDLKNLINTLHEFDIKVVGDVVLNHRCAHYQNRNGAWNIFGGQLNWDDRAVVSDDPHFQGRGNRSSGEFFHAAPNIDHSQEFVRNDLKEWLCWLREDIGYDGWRLDFVRGFWGGYIKDYMEASKPQFAVGEFWDSLSYTYGQMDHNQDAHRQRIVDWINATNGTSGAFDITTKGILHVTLDNCEYWRLSDEKGKPPGLIGWWPSRAVTFIENHDTGSTQGHWRFPCGKEMQGYAYILTHPGSPSIFYDHIFSHFQQEIAHLISIRRRLDIHCRSMVRIKKADGEVYAAEIDEKLVVKIGPGHYEPTADGRRWKVCAEGRDYKIWELA